MVAKACSEHRDRAIEDTGPITNALLWFHDPAPALTWLLALLPYARLVVVLGSMDGRPKLIESAANVVKMRLGSVPTASGRRWLTNAEIGAGAVVFALQLVHAQQCHSSRFDRNQWTGRDDPFQGSRFRVNVARDVGHDSSTVGPVLEHARNAIQVQPADGDEW